MHNRSLWCSASQACDLQREHERAKRSHQISVEITEARELQREHEDAERSRQISEEMFEEIAKARNV